MIQRSTIDLAVPRLLRVDALRAVEQNALASMPSGALMERAGESTARHAITMTAERSGAVLVLAGPGNNGGDALVAARCLHARGIEVRVALLDVPARYRGDAANAWAQWSGQCAPDAFISDIDEALRDATLVIDGLFGIGFSRAPTGKARDWIARVNAWDGPILAIDVPSGLDADTGHIADIAIEADRTLTFIADKPGLHTGDGIAQCGEVVVETLGVDANDGGPFAIGQVGFIDGPALFGHALKPRGTNTNKGSFGSVAVIAGNDGMVGAALLASRMALQSGAGRVYVRLLASNGPGYDVVHPELMLRKTLDGVEPNAVAIGPGLGHDDAAIAMLDTWIATKAAIVLDADALNLVSHDATLMDRLAGRIGNGLPQAILTPHPLEAARLLATDVAGVQKDRLAAAGALADRSQSIVVLKGAGSVIAAPGGIWAINPTGNPGLATGGTGDVLCGLVAGLLAQGLALLDAARAATWLHGQAADDLVVAGIGPIGLTASELMPAIRAAINRLAAR